MESQRTGLYKHFLLHAGVMTGQAIYVRFKIKSGKKCLERLRVKKWRQKLELTYWSLSDTGCMC